MKPERQAACLSGSISLTNVLAEVDGMFAEPMRVASGSDFAHGSAGDAGGELASFPSDSSGEPDHSADDSHGDERSGLWFTPLSEQSTECANACAHQSGSPGGTRGAPKNISHGFAMED